MEVNESGTKEIVPQQVEETSNSSGTKVVEPVEPTDEGKVGGSEETYAPNYKFKVMDKEHEIDEFVRPLIKDAETEKKVRELYEKAYGLDVVKSSKVQLSDELKNIKIEHSSLVGELQGLGTAIQKEDLDTAFEQLRIKPETVFKWAKKKIEEMELPEEQRRALEQSREAQKRLQAVEMQNQQLSNSFRQTLINERINVVKSVVSSPEFSSYAAQFDARAGQPGSFELELLRRGAIANSEGKDPHPQDLAKEIVSLYGLQMNSGTPVIPQASGEKVPVIPNVGSGGSSPAKSKVKSIADLRKLADQM